MVHSEREDANAPPEVLFLASKSMKAQFQVYGDVVTFDLTFNTIKNLHPSGKSWKVGCFLANSSTKKIVPLGLVVTLQ